MQHERFKTAIKGNAICCIRRAAFDTLHVALNANDFSYLNGPSGMGKSFALYYLYCRLSATRDHRVLYINSCSSLCDSAGVSYLFQVASSAFCGDEQFLEEITALAIHGDWSTMLSTL